MVLPKRHLFHPDLHFGLGVSSRVATEKPCHLGQVLILLSTWVNTGLSTCLLSVLFPLWASSLIFCDYHFFCFLSLFLSKSWCSSSSKGQQCVRKVVYVLVYVHACAWEGEEGQERMRHPLCGAYFHLCLVIPSHTVLDNTHGGLFLQGGSFWSYNFLYFASCLGMGLPLYSRCRCMEQRVCDSGIIIKLIKV